MGIGRQDDGARRRLACAGSECRWIDPLKLEVRQSVADVYCGVCVLFDREPVALIGVLSQARLADLVGYRNL